MQKNIAILVEKVAKKLKKLKWTLVAAESCSGGGLAYSFSCSVLSSPLLERGYIVYSNESKIQILKVKPSTLKKHGPVSFQTAKEMAKGALRFSKAQISIAITGLAGPDGDETDTPVGTIWFCIYSKKRKALVEAHTITGKRKIVLNKIIHKALQLCEVYLRDIKN